MRGFAWLLPSLALILCLAAVVWPAVAASGVLLSFDDADRASYVSVEPWWSLLSRTATYSGITATVATCLGWVPGRLLGAALQRRRGFAAIAILLLAPICIPAYVVFYAWWQAWPPGSALHDWAVHHDAVRLLTRGTLLLGLACWSWPLVSWCVAASAAQRGPELEELMRLDGASSFQRLIAKLRGDATMLCVGWLLVFLATFNNTTSFDLASIFTFGNELRAMSAAGASPAFVLRASGLTILIAIAGAVLLWRALASRPFRIHRRIGRIPRWSWLLAAFVWLVSVVLPAALFARGALTRQRLEEFFTLYGRSFSSTFQVAAVSAFLAVLLTWGLTWCWVDHRRWVRAAGGMIAICWLIAALVPSTIVSVSLESAWNLPLEAAELSRKGDGVLAEASSELKSWIVDVIYRTPVILILGYLARFGFAAALLARWASAGEPAALRDLRRVDGARSARALAAAMWPRLAMSGVAVWSIMLVLAMGEVAVTAQLYPPSSSPLAVSLLNDMHYQRPESVQVAVVMIMVAAMVAATLAVAAWAIIGKRGELGDGAPRSADRRSFAAFLVLCSLSFIVGCEPADASDRRHLDMQLSFGSPGRSLGQFDYPRCIDVDEARGVVYVIDKTARVQRFSADGTPEHQWRMPEMENGKPTGVSVASDGRVFVADTHYHRVVVYDPEGRELMRFGRYGEGPGAFIYPTDVAFGPQQRIYVSEYGGNDRVQVFTAEGEYLFGFGSFGEGRGQFARPQSMIFNEERTELFIADSCNHRIVVVDPEGREVRSFGGAGTGSAELHYPYGLTLLADGTLLVAEFGNSRVQQFTVEGASLGIFGTFGARAGELRYPWGVAALGDEIYVLDSGNDRVQVLGEL